MTHFDAGAEFDRQVRTLCDKGFPALTGLGSEALTELLAPLRGTVTARTVTMEEPAEGRVPFVLVLTRELAAIEETVPLLTLEGGKKPGVIDRHYAAGEIARFLSVNGIVLPDARAYILFAVDRGEEFCGAIPDEAMATIAGRKRTLLTVEEGIALVLQYPAVLAKNRCFSLGGSRSGDRRVPALWISQNAPKLGWCWSGNPHTWLGMASAADRAGSVG